MQQVMHVQLPAHLLLQKCRRQQGPQAQAAPLLAALASAVSAAASTDPPGLPVTM